jgi:hypothetical protein
MAWRLHDQVVRGEIDNRTRGRVTGRIWLLGRPAPLELDLDGNAWRDVAGHRLVFRNADPHAGPTDGLATRQEGVAGDITASRKVRVPEVDVAEMMRLASAGLDYPWHWGNALYLEWLSKANGRVVIESSSYELTLEGEALWVMTGEEEKAQQQANGQALAEFMQHLDPAAADAMVVSEEAAGDDDDEPQSAAEASADAEDARQNLLLDRISRRLDEEGMDEDNFERIFDEERARLRRERGEQEPLPPTPEEEEEQRARIEEMNAAADEAMQEYELLGAPEHLDHPLVVRCRDLALDISRATDRCESGGTALHREHPLSEIRDGVMIASGKLAGALNRFADEDDDWPPDPLFAGHILVRLKKARRHLRDALLGLDAADEQDLLTPAWRTVTRADITQLIAQIVSLLNEVRGVLRDHESDPEED